MILNIFILAKSGVLRSLSPLAILEAVAICLCLGSGSPIVST